MRVYIVTYNKKTAARRARKQEDKKMPILQYKCKKCGKRFEELVKTYTDGVFCPDCGGETLRDYSGEMYSSTGKQRKKCTGHCSTCGGCG
ncbi:MAG: FmdB family zinc ribbon protein [Candidatus Scatosoma sp.]